MQRDESLETSRRMHWLRRVLLVKVVLTFLAWGLPALIGPPALLELFGIARPEDPTFLRSFGALAIALGVAYWYAYRDPVKNVAIIKVGVVDNGLAALTVIILGLTVGVSSWFVWASGALAALFCVVFVVLMPRE